MATNTNFLLQEIPKYKSISVVGMAKNAGKTECLKYILENFKYRGEQLAITSIGVDGESKDIVFDSPKPELTFYENMWVLTSETHYRQRKAVAEILNISQEQTAMGRLVLSNIIVPGKMIISGPSHTRGLIKFIQEVPSKTVLIDGALSRMSLASPAVAQAMILCTGAAVSKNLSTLVQKTKYQVELISLPSYSGIAYQGLIQPPTETSFAMNSLASVVENDDLHRRKGVWAMDEDGKLIDLHIPSILLAKNNKEKFDRPYPYLFLSGLVNDDFIHFLTLQKHQPCVVVDDFTKVFVSQPIYRKFINKGGAIQVRFKTNLIRICINPLSPDGYILNSEELRAAMEESIGLEVIDVKERLKSP